MVRWFLVIVAGVARAKHHGHEKVTSGPDPALPEPPLKGMTFSIILPFFPPQVEELRESMLTLGRHVKLDNLDTFFSVSPCKEEYIARSAVTCRETVKPENAAPAVAGELPEWTDIKFLELLKSHGGNLHPLPEWQMGRCAKDVFSWVPPEKMSHMCDDAVICGKVRGCLSEIEKQQRAPLLGWYVQQLVKLGIARFSTSPHLLVLDADCYVIQEISASTMLMTDGTSRIVSFRNAYKGQSISKVGGRWAPRYEVALNLLREDVNATVPEDLKLIGVTPEILSVAVVRRILDRLETIHGAPWYRILAYSRFTEFTLYNTYILLRWDELGRDLHYSTARRNKQVAVWRHDIDEAPTNPGDSADDILAARTAYAELRLRSHISSMQHDKRDNSVGHFFICQDESGLTPQACRGLAEKCTQIIEEGPAGKQGLAKRAHYY